MPTRRIRLVEDLVPTILDSTEWSTPRLLSLALISPSWIWPVRRHLYKHPTITSENQCRYLVRTLEALPSLQPLLIGLNLWLDYTPSQARGSSAVRFVLSLRSLQRITFLSSTANFLMKRIDNNVSVNQLTIWPENHPLPHPLPMEANLHKSPLVEWEPKKASKFTSLTKLVLSGARLHIIPPPVQAPYSFHLTSLSILQCPITYGEIFQLMDPIAWSSLRNLKLVIPQGIWSFRSSIEQILSYCEDNLEHLDLQYDSPTYTAAMHNAGKIFDDAMRNTVQLRALRKLCLVNVGPKVRRSTALREIGARCPNLVDLTISGHIAVNTLCEWGWPSDVGVAFPALTVMAGPGIVTTLDGHWNLSKPVWEAAHVVNSTLLQAIKWKTGGL